MPHIVIFSIASLPLIWRRNVIVVNMKGEDDLPQATLRKISLPRRHYDSYPSLQ